MAAAYRSEQRRLLSFICMSDFMMCDTLHTILVESVKEVLEAVCPVIYPNTGSERNSSSGRASAAGKPPKRPSLQAMHTLVNGSRRQRLSAATAGMQLVPVNAAQQAAAAAEASGNSVAAARSPVFELEILLSRSMEDLVFEPEPEQFQVGAHLTSGQSSPL